MRSRGRSTEESRHILAIDDKFEDDVYGLIDTGKEKGYLTYGDVNDMLPDEIGTPDDIDDLMTTIGTQGIDLLDAPKFGGDKDFELEEGEDVELDLTPGTLEKTNDPVRMYLREMGTVPLLTREGEVEIAKRIERGQMRVLKAISRSPIVIREIAALGEDLKRGVRNVKEVVVFDEEELTEDVVQTRVRATVARIDALVKHQKKIAQLEEKQAAADHKASQGAAPAALADRSREGTDIADCARAEVHGTGAQAAARQGQQDRRHDAHAGAADSFAGAEVRSIEERRPEEGVSAPAEELPDRPRKDRGRCGCINCRTEAHTARDDPGRHGCRAGEAGAD